MKKKYKNLFYAAYALVFLSIILMSSVPPVSRDAQTHHLALPKIWLSEGLLHEVPDMEFSYYPQLIDLLYVAPIAMGVDFVAKYIHFAFGIGCVFLIFFYLRRQLNAYWGALGGLMFITLPIIVKLSTTVYVDLGLLFFFTAALLSSLIWLEDTTKLRWLIISGLCSGLTLSTKYNAILSITILALLLGYYFMKTRGGGIKEQLKLLKYLVFFTFFALLMYSPWLIRNFSLTGNPVYPLYQSVFSKFEETPQSLKENLKPASNKVQPLTLRRLAFNENLFYSLAVPIRVFLEGKDDNPQYFDGRLNPLLLFFPLILFLKKKKHWQSQFLASFVLFVLMFTLLAVDMRIRYIITIITPMIILSIFGLHQINQWLQNKHFALKIVIPAILVSSYFIYNLSYGFTLFKKINPIPFITGDVSRDEYISNKLPYYSLNKLANKVVTTDSKLLGIYTGNRRYYIDVPLTLESTLLFTIASQVKGMQEFRQKLFSERISHILVRVDLFKKELSRKDNKIKRIVTQFFSKHVELLATKDVFALYEIKPLD